MCNKKALCLPGYPVKAEGFSGVKSRTVSGKLFEYRLGDADFFIRRQDQHGDRGTGRGDNPLAAESTVGLRVKRDPKTGEAGADLLSNESRVLSDTAGEDKIVHPAELGIESADIADHGLAESIDGEGGTLVPGLPYVIFPGNVGAEDDLRRIAETLIG